MDSIVQWAIWGVLMSIAMGVVARAWKRQAAAKSEGELRHPKVILVIALATGVPVTKVSWSASASWFRLELSDKRVVRVSVLMVGLDRFTEAMLAGAHGAEMTPSVRELLALCARGMAPSPWG